MIKLFEGAQSRPTKDRLNPNYRPQFATQPAAINNSSSALSSPQAHSTLRIAAPFISQSKTMRAQADILKADNYVHDIALSKRTQQHNILIERRLMEIWQADEIHVIARAKACGLHAKLIRQYPSFNSYRASRYALKQLMQMEASSYDAATRVKLIRIKRLVLPIIIQLTQHIDAVYERYPELKRAREALDRPQSRGGKTIPEQAKK